MEEEEEEEEVVVVEDEVYEAGAGAQGWDGSISIG